MNSAPVSPNAITRSSLHSILTGTSASRGVRILVDGSVARPSSSTSLTCGGCSMLLRWIASRCDASPILITNSPSSWMLLPVSFRTPALRPMFTPISAGLFDTKVKQENGARFTTPSGESVVIHAIGRGTTTPLRRRYAASGERLSAKICMACEGMSCDEENCARVRDYRPPAFCR